MRGISRDFLFFLKAELLWKYVACFSPGIVRIIGDFNQG